MERERALGAHGRRPRRRRWGIGGGHRPAPSLEEIFAYSTRERMMPMRGG
jgi:hypothetical protein